MSERWPGGIVRSTPVTPTGPLQNGTAPGIWTMEQAAYWTKQGLWPTAGNFLAVEDVFSTYLYTGTGSAQTITNGIDLAGKGGLVWIKSRSASTNNFLFDTTRGVNVEINSDTTDANATLANSLTAFNSNGFSVSSAVGIGDNAALYASWTFREAAKFFDVVTYTGDGTYGRTINHNLGIAPGFIIIKRTDGTGNWYVVAYDQDYAAYWQSTASTDFGLNSANSTNNLVGVGNNYFTSTSINLSGMLSDGGTSPTQRDKVNANGATYVAYLFAHDTSSDGIVRCGSFTNSALSVDINLGWEPQWVLYKAANAVDDWYILDSIRGWPNTSANNSDYALKTNNTNTESGETTGHPTARGMNFKFSSTGSTSFIYVAIRRGPMKAPTVGTAVFQPVAYTANNTDNRLINTGIVTDLAIARTSNNVSTGSFYVADRLRGNYSLATALTSNENTDADSYMTPTISYGNAFSAMNGFGVGNDVTRQLNYGSVAAQIAYGFRRAPSFMDVVCYTGTGSARTVDHNLGVAPELIIVKVRNTTSSWYTYNATIGAGNALALNTDVASFSSSASWNNTAPTSAVFTVNTEGAVNGAGNTYVAYLFASCPGVSKVGSYTGNGSFQTINCGFTTGARFVMIKRTDTTGDWLVFDTARGINPTNDPYLAFNKTDAEDWNGTADSVDADSSGFKVDQIGATNVNVNGGTYIFLAVA